MTIWFWRIELFCIAWLTAGLMRISLFQIDIYDSDLDAFLVSGGPLVVVLMLKRISCVNAQLTSDVY